MTLGFIMTTISSSKLRDLGTFEHLFAAMANPIKRLNGKIKRRTEAVGIFPKPTFVLELFYL